VTQKGVIVYVGDSKGGAVEASMARPASASAQALGEAVALGDEHDCGKPTATCRKTASRCSGMPRLASSTSLSTVKMIQ
jgi:hypothetical protein